MAEEQKQEIESRFPPLSSSRPGSSASPQQQTISAFKATARPIQDPLERQWSEAAKRRERAVSRRERLLDPKMRQFGRDEAALQQQIEEKQERRRAEMEREEYHDQLLLNHTAIINEVESSKQAMKRTQNELISSLNKSQARMKAIADNREREAIMSASAFPAEDANFLHLAGEDLSFSERVRRQKQQQQMWLDAQLEQAQAERSRRQKEDEDYNNWQASITAELKNQSNMQYEQRKYTKEQIAAVNKQLAYEKKAREQRMAADAEFQNQAELVTTAKSDLMQEARLYGRANYKGMSLEQRQAVLDGQARQIEESRMNRFRKVNYSIDFLRIIRT